MSKIKFKEQQNFRAIGILGLLAFFIVGISYRFVNQLMVESSGTNANLITQLLLILVLVGGAFVYFWNIRYTVQVNEKGISYQYFPQHVDKKKIKWEDIDKAEVVETPILAEMSGWNVQFANEKRYSVSGRNGLNLRLKNGERVFLGAKNLEKLRKVIATFKK